VSPRDALSGSSSGAISTRQLFPRDCFTHPLLTTASMSDEKASDSSKHNGVERGPAPVAPYQQMTGWRKVYYSPLTQIFLLGFILFMYVFLDYCSCHSYCSIGVQDCSMVGECTPYNGFVTRLNCRAAHLRSPKRCVPFLLLIPVA